MKPIWKFALSVIFILGLVIGYFVLRYPEWFFRRTAARSSLLMVWLKDPGGKPEWMVHAGESCVDAPFVFPTDGYIGFLWDDSWKPGHRHTGLDIFGDQDIGKTPVVAAYTGYLTRLPDWKSSVIIRIPEDPLQPGRQIWTYYTHMADAEGNSFIVPDFPAGTSEVLVKAGTLLGYQGIYSGDVDRPTGLHLHFSIVMDDGKNNFLNELAIENTLDPSPYFNLNLNATSNQKEIPVCP